MASRLTLENVERHAKITRVSKLFQFKCPQCFRVFWRRTDELKPVAGCRQCQRKWKKACKTTTRPARLCALPKHDMIGYARFDCEDCDNSFSNNRAMYDVTQPCRKCRRELFPANDLRPPPKRYAVSRRTTPAASVENIAASSSSTSGKEAGPVPTMPPYRRPAPDHTAWRTVQGKRGKASVDDRQDVHVRRGPNKYRHECSACSEGRCRVEGMKNSTLHPSTGSTIATEATAMLLEVEPMESDDWESSESADYEVILNSQPHADPSIPFYGLQYNATASTCRMDAVSIGDTIHEEADHD
eukprot:scpid55704/ scgid24956/ 